MEYIREINQPVANKQFLMFRCDTSFYARGFGNLELYMIRPKPKDAW